MILLRWLIFIFIALPVQALIQLIYPILYIVWFKGVYKDQDKLLPKHQFNISSNGGLTRHNGALLDNPDDHGAFTMYGFIQKEGLELLQKDGSLIRRINDDGTLNRSVVSGDVVVAWFFANELAKQKASDSVIKSITDTYVSNLGTLSYDEFGQGYVSARCSNFGVNIANDSDFAKSAQPAFGPQFYTTSVVLAGAYHLGLKYKILFWLHWLVMGGWYWAWAPVIYPNYDSLWYVRDITMKALYVHLQVFGPRWWIVKPMQFINDKTLTHQNDLFNAMMNRPVGQLPLTMNPFFSQREDASSFEGDRMSDYVSKAILQIQDETKWND